MEAELSYTGRTYKTVRVTGSNEHDDKAVLDLALSTAREDRSSIFAHTIRRFEDIDLAVVTLHTD